MKRLTVALALLGLFGIVVACSSSDSTSGSNEPTCEAKDGKCPNDATRTDAKIQECKNNKKDAKCGAQYIALEDCAHTKTTCDSTGKTDAKKMISTDCKDEFTAYTNCTLGITTDAGTGGSSDAKTGG
jgi:hypothetical protein